MVEAENIQEEQNSQPNVFYVYNEDMMLHKDENYHSSETGNLIPEDQLVSENRNPEDFRSPEVPIRIKAIHDYLEDAQLL